MTQIKPIELLTVVALIEDQPAKISFVGKSVPWWKSWVRMRMKLSLATMLDRRTHRSPSGEANCCDCITSHAIRLLSPDPNYQT